jgi:preprotein translocase subunit SecD
VVCGNLVSDPITLEEIDGGVAEISGNFTQATADQLALALNSRSG